jgi:hypothetical protein
VIQPLGFIDASEFTAYYRLKFRDRLRDGVLMLRDADPEDVGLAVTDQPILEEWKAAKNLLGRYRSHARSLLKDASLDLGKAWVEMLPGGHGTPWSCQEDEYAQAHIRTRMCMIPAPDAYTYSGHHRVLLEVGVVNIVEHRILNSETNFSAFPRVHLVVDVERPRADKVD